MNTFLKYLKFVDSHQNWKLIPNKRMCLNHRTQDSEQFKKKKNMRRNKIEYGQNFNINRFNRATDDMLGCVVFTQKNHYHYHNTVCGHHRQLAAAFQ